MADGKVWGIVHHKAVSRRRVILWALGTCAVTMMAVCVLAYDREPRYKGKSLSEWLRVYAAAPDNVRRDVAADAIRHMGTNALPFLLEAVRHGVPGWMRQVSPVIGRLPKPIQSKWAHMMAARNRASEAAVGLAILGPVAVPIIPELVADLDNTRRQNGAIRALEAIGRPAVPFLVAAITNKANSMNLRRASLNQIGGLGHDASEAVQVLMECAQREPELLVDMIWPIAATATNAPLVIPFFTNAMQSASVDARYAAILCVLHLGKGARDAVPALKIRLFDSNIRVRTQATNSLNMIALMLGPEAEDYGLSSFTTTPWTDQ